MLFSFNANARVEFSSNQKKQLFIVQKKQAYSLLKESKHTIIPIKRGKRKLNVKKKKRLHREIKHKYKFNKKSKVNDFDSERAIYLIVGIIGVLLAITCLLIALSFPSFALLLYSAAGMTFTFGILFIAVAVGFLEPFF